MSVESIITENLDIWTSAIKTKSASGRGSSKKLELYGIKKLRELILELAVTGKLIEPDTASCSAQVALERSISKKSELISAGKLKKGRSKKNIEDEHFYSYPKHWEAVRLEDLINVINGRAYKKHEMLSEGVPILRVGNLFTSDQWYYSDLILEPEKYIDNGDLIYAWSASFGPFIWEGGKVIYHYHIWKMDIFCDDSLDKEFSRIFLQAISERIKASGNGIAMIHMTKERMEKVIHPLPPLEEQKQIAKKVLELMTLCDRLESQTEASIEAHQTVVKSLLETLTNAKDADELNESWQRISEHFDALFTTEDSIDQLKQTILQLAVMGKLVKQDPNDEPASKLLERIAAEKQQLIKDKKIKKQSSLPEINKEEKTIELRKGWTYSRLDDLCTNVCSGSTPPKSELSESGNIPFLKVYNIQNQEIDFSDRTLFISESAHLGKLKRSVLFPGDVVMNLVGPPLGKVAILPDTYPEWNCNQNIVCFRPLKIELNRYIYTYLKAQIFLKHVVLVGSAGQDFLSGTKSRSIVLPLPPLEEQKRIVDKVENLFLICESLRNKILEVQENKRRLATSITSSF